MIGGVPGPSEASLRQFTDFSSYGIGLAADGPLRLFHGTPIIPGMGDLSSGPCCRGDTNVTLATERLVDFAAKQARNATAPLFKSWRAIVQPAWKFAQMANLSRARAPNLVFVSPTELGLLVKHYLLYTGYHYVNALYT